MPTPARTASSRAWLTERPRLFEPSPEMSITRRVASIRIVEQQRHRGIDRARDRGAAAEQRARRRRDLVGERIGRGRVGNLRPRHGDHLQRRPGPLHHDDGDRLGRPGLDRLRSRADGGTPPRSPASAVRTAPDRRCPRHRPRARARDRPMAWLAALRSGSCRKTRESNEYREDLSHDPHANPDHRPDTAHVSTATSGCVSRNPAGFEIRACPDVAGMRATPPPGASRRPHRRRGSPSRSARSRSTGSRSRPRRASRRRIPSRPRRIRARANRSCDG